MKRFVLIVTVLTVGFSYLGCRSAFSPRGPECNGGGTITYQGEPVGCLYSYNFASSRMDQICPSSGNIRLTSFGFGEGPAVIRERGCLLCLADQHQSLLDLIKPAQPEPPGFSPSISCLNIFQPTPHPL